MTINGRTYRRVCLDTAADAEVSTTDRHIRELPTAANERVQRPRRHWRMRHEVRAAAVKLGLNGVS